VEAVQWQVATRVLALGVNVILEWGFWSHEERMHYRTQAEALGARVELYFLDVARAELWARVSQRNANLPPGTFVISEEQLDLWLSWFQPPSVDELALNDP
jgi:predicted kinase